MRSARRRLAEDTRPQGSIKGGDGLSVGSAPLAFARLLDARGAGRLLGVPHTWLLAQARAGRVPHHRLGHYVRFSPVELAQWLDSNRREVRPRRS